MEPVVDVLAVPSTVATDLTPVLEAIQQLMTIVQVQVMVSFFLCGIVVGCAVVMVFHDLWRS